MLKRSLLLIIAAVLFFTACKKGEDEKPYYLYMNFENASHVGFNDSVLIAQRYTSEGFPLSINAYSKTNGTLHIVLSDTVAGTYTEQLFMPQQEKAIHYFSLNRWIHENGNLFIQSGFVSNVTDAISVTVTRITSGYVEGYFSGNLANVSGGTIKVTNGKFKVPF